jgi:hypothetical protein
MNARSAATSLASLRPPVARLAQDEDPGRASGEARGGRGLEQGPMAMTADQLRGLYTFIAAIAGGAIAFLLVWWFG